MHLSQLPLFLALQVIGTTFNLAIGPRRHVSLCCALGLPIGLMLYVGIALAVMAAGVAYTPPTMIAIGVVLLAGLAVGIAVRGPRLDTAAWRTIAMWMIGFTALAVPVSQFNTSVLSSDSHTMILIGKVLAFDAGWDRAVSQLASWGAFQIIAQSAAMLTAEDHVYGLHVAFGLWFVPLFVLLLREGWREVTGQPASRGGTALVAAALFSIFMVYRHVFYLHTNLASGVYLFSFVTLCWLAERRGDASFLAPATLCLIALGLLRVEAAPIAAAVAAIALFPADLPRRYVGISLAAFVVAVGAWYAALAAHLSPDGAFLTPSRCMLIVGVLVAFFAAWLASQLPGVRRLRRFTPPIVAALAVLAVVGAIALRPGHMLTSLRHMIGNLATLPDWGYAWFAMAVLAALSRFVDSPADWRRFGWIFTAFVALVGFAAVGRIPYHHGPGDSANRMMLQIVPLSMYWLGLALARALAGHAGPLVRRAFTGVLAAMVAVNLAFLVRNQTVGRRTPVIQSRPRDIETLARQSDNERINAMFANYYLLHDAIAGKTVLLPREFRTHALDLERVSRLRVEIVRESFPLPRAAAERLAARASRIGTLLTAREPEPIQFHFQGSAEVYVLAHSDGGGPLMFLPEPLYREQIGQSRPVVPD